MCKNDLVEKTSKKLWDLCADTAIDSLNEDITDKEVEQRFKKFTEILRDFQKQVFPTRPNEKIR